MDKKTLKALQRHDLVEISDAGRRRVFAEIASKVEADQLDRVRQLIVGDETSAKIPGIVRREDNDPRPGMIPVGFVSPFRLEGNRMRIAAFVAQADINALISPTAVLRRPFVARTPCLKALADIAVMAGRLGLEMGVWGSAALEVYTGLPFTDAGSDLDLLIEGTEVEVMRDFQSKAMKIAEQWKCKTDVEVALPSGYGVKLAELFLSTETILAKGLHDVTLLPKQAVYSMLNNKGQKKYKDMEE